jgi:triosephosphate isomerase
MRQKFIIGNRKMYTNSLEAERLAKASTAGVEKL